ncbi:Asp23/Gls24 family envelope stress response protein [Desulfitibacter alkalitolerans]|uniref:Asp23/Gls24 family envelope stress response protein n=1 Tax=Desulfitibacter alkalitolerans TaxID=264641 RepID=UPI0004842E9F|nr:Asp23/Gls24 family envelope stress response protein [Desulfitibacter alkalitolerans]
MSFQLKNDKGNIEISKEVITSIASKAALECYGLAGIPSAGISEGISDLIRKETRKGVKVEVVDGNRLIIEVSIIVMYGTKISEVAQNVMEKVHYTIEEMTGANVERVNIKVQGVKVVE